MSDLKTRRSARRPASILSGPATRSGVADRAAPARPPRSLLGQALERERLRQAHQDAASRRKPAPAAAVEPIDPRVLEEMFAGWEDPARPAPQVNPPPTAHEPDRAARAAPAAEVADDVVWRPLIDPMALVGGVMRSKSIIAATTILGGLLGVMLALSTPKHYVSWAELLVDPRNLQIVDRDLTGSGWLPSEATLSLIENQVRIMRSGPVVDQVVDKLHLDEDPEFNGTGRSLGLGAVISSLRSLLSPSDGPTSGEMRRILATGNVAAALSIERTGKTFIIEIQAKTRDPQKSALIANTLIDVYMAKAAELQSDSAGRASGELGGRLEELRAEVAKSERRVEEYKAEHDLVDAKGVLIGDDELIRLNDQLSAARARTLELNARAASARGAGVDDVISGGLPEQVTNGALSQLRVQYSTLAQEVAKASTRLGPRHPERLALQAQIADARKGIDAELRRVVAAVQVELKRAVGLEQDLSARLAQLKARQATVSERLVELRELERDAAAKRTVYESFLLRARETGEQQSINTGNISVVSRASAPIEPTGPSRAIVAILGTVAGFMAGIGIGLLRGAWASFRGGSSAPSVSRPHNPRPNSAPVVPPAAAPPAARAAAAPQPEPVPPPPPVAATPPPFMPPLVQAVAQPPAAVWAAPPQMMVWPQPVAWPQPVMAPAWMPPTAPPAPAVWPGSAPVPSAPPPEDHRLDSLRRGLAEFRTAVEDLAAARTRRRT